jgi:hypothetical protein
LPYLAPDSSPSSQQRGNLCTIESLPAADLSNPFHRKLFRLGA